LHLKPPLPYIRGESITRGSFVMRVDDYFSMYFGMKNIKLIFFKMIFDKLELINVSIYIYIYVYIYI
jgi:hypothetical protein